MFRPAGITVAVSQGYTSTASGGREPSRPLDAALAYARERGWAVFPLHTPLRDERDQLVCSCHHSADCTTIGKHPRWQRGILEHGFQDASKSAAVIQAWWRLWPRANIGIATGAVSGLIVLDIDPAHGGVQSLTTLQGTHQLSHLPPTLTALSGGGGYHRYFGHPGAAVEIAGGTNVFGDHLPGLDLRADGGYIVAAPSLHESGRRYAWAPGTIDIAIAEMPRDWLRFLAERTERMRTSPPEVGTPGAPNDHNGHHGHNGHQRGDRRPPSEIAAHWLEHYAAIAREGTRNETGTLLALQLRDTAYLDQEAAEAVMADYAARVSGLGRTAYGEDEARATVRSIYARPARPPAVSATWRGSGTAPAPAVTTLAAVDVRETLVGADSDPALPDEAVAPAPPGPPPADEDGDPHQRRGRRRYQRTEMGNAERLLDRHGADIRYSKALGWCVWDGTRWRPDDELAVRRMAKETVRAIYAEAGEQGIAAGTSDDDGKREQLAGEAKLLMEWAVKSERERMIAAMLSLARDACEVAADVFDRDPWLLGCANGVLDLRTGRLRPPRREDYLMHRSPVVYDPRAEAPTFERFLRQIMCEREELVEYLQRFFGYCLTGHVHEQVWHLLVGATGENGKSTLIETIAAILGDYAGTLEPESLTITGASRDANAPSPDIAALAGKRFVFVTETEQGARLATARLKKLTGGDTLTGRFLRRDPFTFRPEFKLAVYTNHKPQASETTHAFWRRVRYVPFDWSVKDHPALRDPELPQKLRAEASGILAWMVRGCLAWQREGLDPPAAVEQATRDYQADQDTLAAFMADRCVVAAAETVTLGALFEAYTSWCNEGGERPLSKRKFTTALGERGFTQSRTMAARLWVGIGLASTPAMPAAPSQRTFPTFGLSPERSERI